MTEIIKFLSRIPDLAQWVLPETGLVPVLTAT